MMPVVIPAVVDLLYHNVCVGLLCDMYINSRGVCTDLDVCFVLWWNMPSVKAPNMHILNLPDLNYSYHTHVHRIVHSLQRRPRINGALFLLRQLVLCLFIIKAAGFTDHKRSSLTSHQQKKFWGCNVNYFEFNRTFVFELFAVLN